MVVSSVKCRKVVCFDVITWEKFWQVLLDYFSKRSALEVFYIPNRIEATSGIM
jgi:hypothetical protein